VPPSHHDHDQQSGDHQNADDQQHPIQQVERPRGQPRGADQNPTGDAVTEDRGGVGRREANGIGHRREPVAPRLQFGDEPVECGHGRGSVAAGIVEQHRAARTVTWYRGRSDRFRVGPFPVPTVHVGERDDIAEPAQSDEHIQLPVVHRRRTR
jgi:hypothetical protein